MLYLINAIVNYKIIYYQQDHREAKIYNIYVMEKIIFKQQSHIPDLLNSEGPLLSLVEIMSYELENERLYLKGKVGFGKAVYCKVNETALNFFFSGRISVKELFLLRNDEPFIVEIKEESGDVIQNLYWLNNNLENEFLNKLPYYNLSYFAIPESSKIESPNETVIKKLDLFYINSHGAIL